jgi:hypothetical protein
VPEFFIFFTNLHKSDSFVLTMRDVFGIGSGGSSRRLDRPEVDMKMSSIPGYLELTPQKMERLICHEPIEQYYEVEDQPFARYENLTLAVLAILPVLWNPFSSDKNVANMQIRN